MSKPVDNVTDDTLEPIEPITDNTNEVTNDELVAAAIAEQLMQSGSKKPPEKLRKAFENT